MPRNNASPPKQQPQPPLKRSTIKDPPKRVRTNDPPKPHHYVQSTNPTHQQPHQPAAPTNQQPKKATGTQHQPNPPNHSQPTNPTHQHKRRRPTAATPSPKEQSRASTVQQGGIRRKVTQDRTALGQPHRALIKVGPPMHRTTKTFSSCAAGIAVSMNRHSHHHCSTDVERHCHDRWATMACWLTAIRQVVEIIDMLDNWFGGC